MTKKIFLAGASGMVGRAIIDCFISECKNFEIKAIVNTQNNFVINDPRVKIIQGDLRSFRVCKELSQGCDYAIMAAANTGGAAHNLNNTYDQINDNLIMNVQMLKAFQESKVKRILQIGSATCYQSKNSNIAEDEIDFNINPHQTHFGIGWTTRFLEKVAEFLYHKYNMEIIMIRAANVFGPYAQFNPQRSNFIPALIRKAVNKMDPFEVWGSPLTERDVIFSKNFAYYCYDLIMNDQIKFDVFNIGSGCGYTIKYILELILDILKFNPNKIEFKEITKNNLNKRILNCDKLKKSLRKNYNFVDLKTGLTETINWWKKFKSQWHR